MSNAKTKGPDHGSPARTKPRHDSGKEDEALLKRGDRTGWPRMAPHPPPLQRLEPAGQGREKQASNRAVVPQSGDERRRSAWRFFYS
ncbi:hypothetical protein MTO96_000829 [Rhipicephalus appendiculatus]